MCSSLCWESVDLVYFPFTFTAVRIAVQHNLAVHIWRKQFLQPGLFCVHFVENVVCSCHNYSKFHVTLMSAVNWSCLENTIGPCNGKVHVQHSDIFSSSFSLKIFLWIWCILLFVLQWLRGRWNLVQSKPGENLVHFSSFALRPGLFVFSFFYQTFVLLSSVQQDPLKSRNHSDSLQDSWKSEGFVYIVCSILQRFLWRRSFQSILPWMKPLLWTSLPFVGVSFVLRLLTFFGVQQTVHIFFSLSTAQKISMDVDWVMLQVGLNFLCRKCRMFRSVFQRGSCHDEFRIPRYLLTFGFSFLNSFVGGKQCISRHSLQLLAWNQQDARFLFWNSET